MLQKLMSKKWMNMCLLLGCVLLIATVVSFPLYQTAAYNRMLQDMFRNYEASEGKWPTMASMRIVSKKDPAGANMKKMEELMDGFYENFGVTERETIYYYYLSEKNATSEMNRSDLEAVGVRLGFMSSLEEHAKLLDGEFYSSEGISGDGALEVVISQSAMVRLKVLVGETFRIDGLKDASGNTVRFQIVGVFDKADTKDPYWQYTPEQLNNVCLLREDVFRRMFTGENIGKFELNCNYFPMFEYEDITAADTEALMEKTTYFAEEGPYKNTVNSINYLELLGEYNRKQNRIEATLVILQVPVLILLGAFLFMISGQMYEMERNEISVIKSRGSSGGQIFRLYLYQSSFLTLMGGVFGVPLGAFFSRVLGSARNFLEFDSSQRLDIVFTREALVYTLAAMFVTLCIMTLPAIKHSKVTIVKLKQQKAVKRKSWWEKIFLDVVLLGISLYGYYSFSKTTDALEKSVLMGETLDPLLYVSSSLFIVGAGLLFLRLQPYLIQLLYLAGKKFWKPASYASFMENLKNGRKQQFIMLFLILTISLGMYHATVARTILQNAKENTAYLDGADVIFKEVWTDNSNVKTADNEKLEFCYFEPDTSKYLTMDFADKYTKVIYDENAYIKDDKTSRMNVTLMGIHTREFGELTWLDTELNGKPYYEYLNELAVTENGILVSDNFRTLLGYKVGDKITINNSIDKQTTGVIVDFFQYWPGYKPTSLELSPDGNAAVKDCYQVVAHFGQLQNNFGLTPYEYWISLKEGSTSEDVYDWITENGVRVSKYVNKADDMEETVADPLLQGTNGVLTMGFLVTIILCAVGYLIYWVMSIRSREMIFGVLRACGMHKGELIHMLMNEQLFSGVFSILAGIGIGKLTSVMFVPMLQKAYAASNQVLPMKLIVNEADMLNLYGVIAGVVLLCLAILITLLFKLNVTKALKLGEE